MPEPGRTAFSALRSSSHPIGDLVLAAAARLAASIILFLFGGLIVSLLAESWPVIHAFGAEFLWSHRWDPPSDAFGALAPIYGTLITALIALWIAAPISFGIAFFLTELSPAWLRRPLGAAIELLAAIPSIVYGMWGLMVFAPVFAEYIQQPLGQFLGPLPLIGLLFQGPPIGIGLLCAGIILAIMIIPYIASVMCEVFALTPVMLKESAYGIGCTTWEVMRYVVLPYTQSGVMGGVILGLGRALGETMAVTFVIGNSNALNDLSLFSPGNSITSMLANEFAEAGSGLHTSALMTLGLMLFLITLAVLAFSKMMTARMARVDIDHRDPTGDQRMVCVIVDRKHAASKCRRGRTGQCHRRKSDAHRTGNSDQRAAGYSGERLSG